MLLKNSAGAPSASFTIMIVGFIVVTLWLLVSIVSKIGHFEIRPFSGSEAMAYLSPLLLLYYGRRKDEIGILPTDARASAPPPPPSPTPEKTETPVGP